MALLRRLAITALYVLVFVSVLVGTRQRALSVEPDIVIYAADVTSYFGAWSRISDPTAAAGTKLVSSNTAADGTIAPVVANPTTDYFEVTFSAPANTAYRLWLRMQALNNSKYNDSLWVQFSDSADYPINTTNAL